jgi:type II secretory pathway pseudopilin PulG
MKKQIKTSRNRKHLFGYTLTELMVSLTIFTFTSTAVSTLMFATYNTNRHIKGMADASSASEIALRRIVEVLRSSRDVQYTDPVTGLYVETPPDSSDTSYVFIYYTGTNPETGHPALWEKIESVVGSGSSLLPLQNVVIIDNLNSFTVTRQNPGVFPESYKVDLILNATPVPISRSVVITARNLTS